MHLEYIYRKSYISLWNLHHHVLRPRLQICVQTKYKYDYFIVFLLMNHCALSVPTKQHQMLKLAGGTVLKAHIDVHTNGQDRLYESVSIFVCVCVVKQGIPR